MARQAQKMEARRDFWLYIDEFQHFISPSMEKILTGARKYRLGFTLAHQDLHQLQSNAKVASAVMTQPCTRIVLGVGDDDAKKLAEGFTSFDAQCLKTLEKFHAIARVERNDFDFNLALRKPESATGGEERKAAVIAASRAKYATPRADVEAALLAEIRPDAGKTKPPVSASEGIKATPMPVTPPAPTSPSVVPKAPAASTVSEKKAAPPTLSSPPAVTAVVSPPVTAPHAEVPNLNPTEVTGADAVSQHESLKEEIRTEAESLDFTVSSEQSIPQHGRIDLILTRGTKSIACEISVTTPPETEADHIRLRLKAGFQHVAVISANRRKLNLIQEAYSKKSGTKATSKVGFYTPKEFFAQLFTWATDDPEGGKIEKGKPRKQNFNFDLTPEDIARRAEEEQEMLEDLKQLMARKNTG